eukprot:5882215-Amphidinium_carterae.2
MSKPSEETLAILFQCTSTRITTWLPVQICNLGTMSYNNKKFLFFQIGSRIESFSATVRLEANSLPVSWYESHLPSTPLFKSVKFAPFRAFPRLFAPFRAFSRFCAVFRIRVEGRSSTVKDQSLSVVLDVCALVSRKSSFSFSECIGKETNR